MRSLPRAALPLLACLALLAPCRSLRAEIYQYTDDEGRLHFTEDLSKVPPGQRGGAEAAARRTPGSARVQRYATPDAGEPGPAKVAPADRPGRRVYRIPVDAAGGALVVPVRINDLVSAPFVVDTGASDVVLPEAVAEALGLRPDGRTPHQTYATANGPVRVPVVTLESVQVGEARVENVRAAILPNVSMGLLGLSFFDHFAYSVEREQGVLTLVREEGARVPNEGHWRRRFATLRVQIHTVEERMGGLTSAHTRLQGDLEAQKTALEAELDALDLEADRAGVPQSWRQ